MNASRYDPDHQSAQKVTGEVQQAGEEIMEGRRYIPASDKRSNHPAKNHLDQDEQHDTAKNETPRKRRISIKAHVVLDSSNAHFVRASLSKNEVKRQIRTQ